MGPSTLLGSVILSAEISLHLDIPVLQTLTQQQDLVPASAFREQTQNPKQTKPHDVLLVEDLNQDLHTLYALRAVCIMRFWKYYVRSVKHW